MLNKPKFMIPSTNIEECVIDVNSSELFFSCIIDGNEAVYAWRIKIYRLNDNILVYDTGKVECSPPFIPIDEKNRNNTFSKNLKNYQNTATLTETENSTSENPEYYEFVNWTDEYYWVIEMWNYSDKSNDISTVKSCEEVFYANSTPTVEIKHSADKEGTYIPLSDAILKFNKYYFKASYNQAEDVPIKRYGWKIIDKRSGQKLIDTITTKQIYGTSDNIICNYNGFMNDSSYDIQVFIETQNGYKYLSDIISFSVSYGTGILDGNFKVQALAREPGILNDWNDINVMQGKSVGKVDYKKNYPIGTNYSVIIPDDSYIEYDYGATSELNISEKSYIVLSMQMMKNPDDTTTGTEKIIFSAEGKSSDGIIQSRNLWYKDGAFHYYITDENGNGTTIDVKVPYTPNPYVWYIITMSPYLGSDGSDTFLRVITKRALNGLYPSDNLYPSTELYPSRGIWEV